MNNKDIFTDNDDEYDNTAEVVNISGSPARFSIDGSWIKLKPGERARVNKMYARQQRSAENRDPVQSVVENLTGGRVVPATDKRAPQLAQVDEAELA